MKNMKNKQNVTQHSTDAESERDMVKYEPPRIESVSSFDTLLLA